MNRIFLIGNGFDLAHGLKTSYSDFINRCFDFDKNLKRAEIEIEKFTNRFNHYVSYKPLTDPVTTQNSVNLKLFTLHMRHNSHRNKTPLRSDLPEFTDILNEKTTIVKVGLRFHNEFLGKLIRLQKARENKTVNWVDIENYYFQELNECNSVETLQKEFEEVKSLLKTYLSSLPEANTYNSLIQKILHYKINSTEINRNKLADVNNRNLHNIRKLPNGEKEYLDIRDTFISFNYTNTLQLYNIDNAIHIHGTLGDSIIFGFGDEEAEKFKEIRNNENPYYQRNIKTFDYLERSEYAEIENLINSKFYQVVILGHSCGIADKTFLKTLFEHKNCVSIKPYYFKNEISGTDNYRDIIIGISRCFEDNAAEMRSTVVDKTKTGPFSILGKEKEMVPEA